MKANDTRPITPTTKTRCRAHRAPLTNVRPHPLASLTAPFSLVTLEVLCK
jgi:hypothetical protein